LQLCAQTSAVEQCLCQCGRDRGAAGGVGERQQRGAGESARAGQLHAGQQRGARGGDVGIGRRQACFGGGDVGAAGEQIGGQAGGDVGYLQGVERVLRAVETLRKFARQQRQRGAGLTQLH